MKIRTLQREIKTLTRQLCMPGVLLVLLIPLLVQCGIMTEENSLQEDCLANAFNGGTYSFTVEDVQDECLGGIMENPLLGVTSPAIDLFAAEDLPKDITLSLTGILEISGTLYTDGNVFKLTASGELYEVEIPGIGFVAFSATTDGTLCPTSDNRIEAEFVIEIESVTPGVDLVKLPCTLTLSATGYQGL